jgi:NitT/TauT family transport system permease protein
MVNGELLIALVGIGGQLVRYGNVFDAEGVLAIVLLIVVLSLAALRVFWYVDQRLTGWLPDSR